MLSPQDFSRKSHTTDLQLVLQWLLCLTPGVKGSALGQVGLVSVYCDWVKQEVLSQWGGKQDCLSRSVPKKTLAYPWDVKQPKDNCALDSLLSLSATLYSSVSKEPTNKCALYTV